MAGKRYLATYMLHIDPTTRLYYMFTCRVDVEWMLNVRDGNVLRIDWAENVNSLVQHDAGTADLFGATRPNNVL